MSPYILPAEEEDAGSASNQASTSTTGPSVKRITSHSIRPFSLIDGDNLVIPQKPLYALYGHAVKTLSTFPRDVLHPTTSDRLTGDDKLSAAPADETLQQIDDSTKCILIQTPEHGRAMNLRKRLFLYRLAQKGRRTAEEKWSDLIRQELHLTELILGIAANAKMGPLWHHRKWLYSLSHSIALQDITSSDNSLLDLHLMGGQLRRVEPIPLSTSDFEHELDLVNVCAERYPRNYQAWAYRLWVIKGQVMPPSTIRDRRRNGQEENASTGTTVLDKEYEAIERHLSTHITDYTGATHLLRVVDLSMQDRILGGRSLGLLDRCWTFALDFVTRYPYKETPWLLLRGILALYKQQSESSVKSRSGIYEARMRDALSLAEEVLSTRTTRRSTAATEATSQSDDWEDQQAASSLKYATRSLFYMSCKDEVPRHASLGSSEARGVLEKFR